MANLAVQEANGREEPHLHVALRFLIKAMLPLRSISVRVQSRSVGDMNTSIDKSDVSICEIAGCTDHAISERWVIVSDGSQRRIEVCWKHAKGELDPTALEAPTG